MTNGSLMKAKSIAECLQIHRIRYITLQYENLKKYNNVIIFYIRKFMYNLYMNLIFYGWFYSHVLILYVEPTCECCRHI